MYRPTTRKVLARLPLESQARFHAFFYSLQVFDMDELLNLCQSAAEELATQLKRMGKTNHSDARVAYLMRKVAGANKALRIEFYILARAKYQLLRFENG